MSKRPLEWHRDVYDGWMKNIVRQRLEVDRMVAKQERDEAALAFYAGQIGCASKAGKTEFDAERYLVKRKLKSVA